jgi:hypothetical protein
VENKKELDQTWEKLKNNKSANLKLVRDKDVDPNKVLECLIEDKFYMWTGHGSGLKHLQPHLTTNIRIHATIFLFGCQSVAID